MKVRFGESPITLLSYFVPELSYKVLPGKGFEPTNWLKLEPGDIQVTIGYRDPDDDDKWRFELKIELAKETSFAYHFIAFVVGDFMVASDVPESQKTKLIHVNAPSMLYSIARELLTNATARSPFPPILLPTIRFMPEDESEIKMKPAPKGKPAAKTKPKTRTTTKKPKT